MIYGNDKGYTSDRGFVELCEGVIHNLYEVLAKPSEVITCLQKALNTESSTFLVFTPQEYTTRLLLGQVLGRKRTMQNTTNAKRKIRGMPKTEAAFIYSVLRLAEDQTCDDLTIEHILPERWVEGHSQGWNHIPKNVRGVCVGLLGNLSLIP